MNSPVVYYSFHGILDEVEKHLPFSNKPERSKALLWSASHGFYEVVKVLLEYGCNVHIKSPNNFTPYQRCCLWGKPGFDIGIKRGPIDQGATKKLLEDYMYMETCTKVSPRLLLDACFFQNFQPTRHDLLCVWVFLYPDRKYLPPNEIDWTYFIVCAPNIIVQWIHNLKKNRQFKI